MTRIVAPRGSEIQLAIPVVDASAPEGFLSGGYPSTDAYHQDGNGSWVSFSLSNSFSEISGSGIYELLLSPADTAYDQVIIKYSCSGGASGMVWVSTKTYGLSTGVDYRWTNQQSGAGFDVVQITQEP